MPLVCAFMGTGVGLLFNQLSPMAFAAIQWKYYAVFIACDAVAAFCFFVFYPYVFFSPEWFLHLTIAHRETKGKTLEEMAVLFGDDVAFSEYIGTAGAADAPVGKHASHYDAETEHDEELQIENNEVVSVT